MGRESEEEINGPMGIQMNKQMDKNISECMGRWVNG